ncbi:cytochrome P450 [Stakelama saccharophila]|uniref:Cytochrome P450 n=1 Tax=Stakelama saccharophila TaxID=3075605 RepID=A0ABZ0BEA0_9SPHN|nr:cytochrome P450 [Stakelama sp. W311]WNO54699.1 cytochrome P450 [Stakelama sp. W311]
MPIPADPAFDSTLSFLREGYDYIGNRCRRLGSDIFTARLMLRPVTCIAGEDAARHFYDGEHFTRVGAMPPTTVRLLQDKGSVQALDGAAHRARKAMFLAMMDDAAIHAAGDMFDRQWDRALRRWREAGAITFHDEAVRLCTATACEWIGLSLGRASLDKRAEEQAAMVAGAGSVGPNLARGLWLRRRSERWARRVIHALRDGRLAADSQTPIARLATFRDANGALLDRKTAGVELLNLLRPTVAVARFLTFAGLALHEHPAAAQWLGDARDPARVHAFAQEVRRYYPFFPVIGGRVRKPFTWRGHDFGDGDWVLLGLHATNHDPRLWDRPERFDPARRPESLDDGFRLVPQGAGDHAADHRCPGEWLTLELMRRAIVRLRALGAAVPPQDLTVPLDRFPTLPRSGLRLRMPAGDGAASRPR